MRWKCRVAYDGTDFFGWQSQAGGNTVQDIIEERLMKVFGREVRIHGSGRTDSGVHARGQVFHFDAEWTHGAENLHKALISSLPEGISIASTLRAADDFHARFSAKGKRYSYTFYEGWASPFETRFMLSLKNLSLDIDKMQEAANSLLGKHDFTAFGAENGNRSKENPVKDLRKLEIIRRGSKVRITTEASGYLYKMVRSLSGALMHVGTGKLQPGDLKIILLSKKRTHIVQTAPAKGLVMEKVFY